MAEGSKSKTPVEPTAQEVHIDLPGEKVEVWLSSSKLVVTLRKHRDVIFDLRLGAGKIYTVESSISDIYNANSKKIMFAKRKEVATFGDGERLHLWITRGFKGELLLKCDGKLMMRIDPSKVDRQQYDPDPKTKPAPIIVSLGQSSQSTSNAPHQPSAIYKPVVQQSPAEKLPHPVAAPVDDDCSIVCVVDGRLDGAPGKILEFFKRGGGKSGLVDVDPNDVATKNWILGQIAGTAAYTRDNWAWLRASIDSKTWQGLKLVRAQVHLVGGKVRFYFSGYSKFNSVFGPGGFGPGHERVISIFAGIGKTSSSFKAVGQGILGSVKGNALVSFIFSSAASVAEWKQDVSKDGYDLASNLLMGLIKTLLAAAVTVAVVAVILIIVLALSSAAVPVIVVGALTIVVGIGINYGFDALDKAAGRVLTGDKNNTDGLSAVIAPHLRQAGKEIEASWQYLMAKFPHDYKEIVF